MRLCYDYSRASCSLRSQCVKLMLLATLAMCGTSVQLSCRALQLCNCPSKGCRGVRRRRLGKANFSCVLVLWLLASRSRLSLSAGLLRPLPDSRVLLRLPGLLAALAAAPFGRLSIYSASCRWRSGCPSPSTPILGTLVARARLPSRSRSGSDFSRQLSEPSSHEELSSCIAVYSNMSTIHTLI